MIISKRLINLIADKIATACQGQEHLEDEIEVVTPYFTFFVDVEFTDKASYQESSTGAWLGTVDLTVHWIKVFNQDEDQLEIENLAEVKAILTEKNSY